MLSEQTTNRDNQEQPLTLPGTPYPVFPPTEEEAPASQEMDSRQRAEHLTATLGYLATLQMQREG